MLRITLPRFCAQPAASGAAAATAAVDRKSSMKQLAAQHGIALTLVVVATQTCLFALVFALVSAGLDGVVVKGVDKFSSGLGFTGPNHFSDNFEASLKDDSAAAKGGRAAMALVFFSTMPSAILTFPFYVWATPKVSRVLARTRFFGGAKKQPVQ